MKSDIELKLIEIVDTYCPDYPYSGLVDPMTHLDIIEKVMKTHKDYEELEEEMLEYIEALEEEMFEYIEALEEML
ncbi:MAG: hypothetical protein GY834_10770 [Bacteroidetes bacterium]|nr:hypothetical protein [Bacteroidota bacterium]